MLLMLLYSDWPVMSEDKEAIKFVYANAYVRTIQDLVDFPRDYPAIFTMLIKTGIVPKLQEYVR